MGLPPTFQRDISPNDGGSKRQKPELALPTYVSWGNVRFFQLLLVFMYLGSGIAKVRGGWLTNPHVIWSHLHDSYQTAFTYFMARSVPVFCWSAFCGSASVEQLRLARDAAHLKLQMKRGRLKLAELGSNRHAPGR